MSEARIRGCGSVPKCHGSATLFTTVLDPNKNPGGVDPANCDADQDLTYYFEHNWI